MSFRRRAIVAGSLAVLVLGLGALRLGPLRPRLPAAERGRRLAEREGCISCHGPEGTRGTSNPGRPYPSVPTFEGDLMMYAKDAGEVRAWIRDGVPPARAASESWKRERDAGTLRMPAFGKRLSARKIEDLTVFVLAMAGEPAPQDSLPRHGRERARALGCFGCHGPGGRFARPNPRSLKGYIPSWDGDDFLELVRDRAEFEAWTRHGVSPRFQENRLARFFLRRAAVHMPKFERHLEPGDLEALWAYVTWLREQSPELPADAAPSP